MATTAWSMVHLKSCEILCIFAVELSGVSAELFDYSTHLPQQPKRLRYVCGGWLGRLLGY